MSIWFCCANIRSGFSNEYLHEGTGAFVNVVAKADNEANFVNKIEISLNSLGFTLEYVEELENFDSKLLHDQPEEEIMGIYHSAKKSENVFFGTFHTYDEP